MEPMNNPKIIYKNFVGFMWTKDYATESVKEELQKGITTFDEKEEPQADQMEEEQGTEVKQSEETFEIKFYRKTICIRFNKEDDDEKKIDKVKGIIKFWDKVLSDARRESGTRRDQTGKLEYMLIRETLKLSDKLITNLEFSLKEEKSKEILDKWWDEKRIVLLFDLIYRCPNSCYNTKNPSLVKELFNKKKDGKLKQINMENRGRVRMKMRELWSKIDRRKETEK